VYTGEYDLVTNSLGLERWLDAMNWSGKRLWNHSPFQTWKVDGNIAGKFRSYGNVALLILDDAGHVVGEDQPSHSFTMMKRFILGIPFAS
jgi:carboxypeptidase C (cathepsin A)